MNYLCFDIGGTMTKYGILNDNYEFLLKGSYPSNVKLGGQHILESIISKIEEILKSYSINGVSISTCGVVDYIEGKIAYANDICLDYTGINFKQEILSRFNLPCCVENDVNCFCLSESINHPNVDYLMITVGTGIGGGIFINNQLIHGCHLTAGEFGNMIIDDSILPWEKQASMSSLVQKGIDNGLDITNGKDLFDLYDNKNEVAIKVVSNFYDKLAIGICNLAYCFNPQYIFIGGGISNRPHFIDELSVHIDKYVNYEYFNETKILPCSYQNDGGLIGSLVNYKRANSKN